MRRWALKPKNMAMKTGKIVHQTSVKNPIVIVFWMKSWQNLTIFKATKNTAIVERNSDLFLNSSLTALTTKGPPIPNNP